jgi:hypothetical protein
MTRLAAAAALVAALVAAVAAGALPVSASAGECDQKGDVRCARTCLDRRLDPAQAAAFAADLAGCLT